MSNRVLADVVRRDAALPGLPILFDPPRLARILEEHSGASVPSLEPVYLRYKRATNCVVGYRVEADQAAPVIYAKALAATARAKLHKAAVRSTVATWLGDAPLVLTDAAVSVWAYPNDARLRALRHVADPQGRRALISAAPEPLRGDSPVFRTLSYKPERRYVAEIRPRNESSRRGVLKMYRSRGFREALVRTASVHSRGALRVPAQLAADPKRRTLLLEWLPGRPASDLVYSTAPLDGRLTLAGSALGELHGQELNHDTGLRTPYEPAALSGLIRDLEWVFPALADLLTRLRVRLGDAAPWLGAGEVPLHGDFHLRQVLLSESGVAFVDFDRSGAGPAAADLASCRARLERDVLAGSLTRDRADAVFEELLKGYAGVRQLPSSAALDACTAASLTLLLAEPFRMFRGDVFELTSAMLDRALALLAPAIRTTVP